MIGGMDMIFESNKLSDYLLELKEVNYSNPIVKEKADELFDVSNRN